MNNNLKRIYIIECYKNRRHCRPETICYFLYPEHTEWAQGMDECECNTCEYTIIRTKLVDVDSSDFHKACENSDKYIEENYGEVPPSVDKLKEEIEDLKRKHSNTEECGESFRMKLFKEKQELKNRFNDIIKLVKMCNTPEMVKQLQELNYLSEA